jgi:ABC-type phosphate transport system substrate-binding protein
MAADTRRPRTRAEAGAVFMVALLLVLVAGGEFPMAGGRDSSQTLETMKAQNARGYLFIRGSDTPWASAGFMAIGTWGTDPPPYDGDRRCAS